MSRNLKSAISKGRLLLMLMLLFGAVIKYAYISGNTSVWICACIFFVFMLISVSVYNKTE
jgi:uncharacterized membrane protein